MTTVGSHTQNSTLSTVQSITVPPQASHVLLQAQTQDVRVTIDGTAPTATKGFLIVAAWDWTVLPVPSNGTLKAIEVAASAKLDYQFIQGI